MSSTPTQDDPDDREKPEDGDAEQDDGEIVEIPRRQASPSETSAKFVETVTSKPDAFMTGDIVRPSDRANLGMVVGKYGTTYAVFFRNPSTGKVATVSFEVSDLEIVRPAASIAQRNYLTLTQLESIEPPAWLVKNLFRRGELGVIYGQPSAGKTFVALDLALRLAAGLDWCGKRAHLSRVLYVAGEGAHGLAKRVRAWRNEFVKGDLAEPLSTHFQIVSNAVHFFNDIDFNCFAMDLDSQTEKPDLIVIDTLARAIVGGDENSAKDMGEFVARCDRLRIATGATILLIHHSGKNGDSERGSSALRGAADFMLSVSRPKGANLVVKCDKLKDGEYLQPLEGHLMRAELGFDEDGEPITSCFVRYQPPTVTFLDSPTTFDRDCSTIFSTLKNTFLRDGCPTEKLRKAAGLDTKRYYAALKVLHERGYVKKTREGKSIRVSPTEDSGGGGLS